MSSTAAAAPATSKAKGWKRLAKYVAWAIVIAIALSITTLWDTYHNWRDEQDIQHMEQKLRNAKKLQDLKVKSGYTDHFQDNTDDLADKAAEGHNVNGRYNRQATQYEDRVGGVGVKAEHAGASVRTMPLEYSANLVEFHNILAKPETGQYVFQVDARDLWRDTITTNSNTDDKLILHGSGKTCAGPLMAGSSAPTTPCVGPNGQDGPAKFAVVQPDKFPVGEAWFQALVGRFVDTPNYQGKNVTDFQIGDYKEVNVPPGKKIFQVRENLRENEREVASGGHVIDIQLQLK
jgi:hypothetical protein